MVGIGSDTSLCGKGLLVPLNVLIVEDSPTMRRLLAAALSSLPDATMIEAGDGVEALKHLVGGVVPHIILTDINMPIMDGLKLVKRVRANEKFHGVPIIVVTTESAEEDRQRALTLGANSYITKPIDPAAVLAEVRRLLRL